jgi:drug/metabolite transporter (DMT)-like permease
MAGVSAATVTSQTDTRTPTLGALIVLGSAALFGMLGPLSNAAYDAGLDPLTLVAWRSGLATLAIVGVVAWLASARSVRIVRPVDVPARERRALVAATLAAATLNVCIFSAFELVTVALALLGFYTFPAMIAAVGVVTGREPLDRTRAVALVLALVGMALVVIGQLDPAGGVRFDALGLGLALGAAVSQTVFVSVSRVGYPSVPTVQATVVLMGGGVLAASALAVIRGTSGALVEPLADPSVLPLLVFAAIATAAIPTLGFLAGIRALGGTRAGILMLFEPVVGVTLAAWLLGERLLPIQILGGAAILVAAALIQRGMSTQPERMA